MCLHIIKTPTGEVALFANGQLILDGDLGDDSARLVEQTGERLSEALSLPLSLVTANPAAADWSWDDLIPPAMRPSTQVVAEDSLCHKCGSPLVGGRCSDSTCPYSDWPQQVSLDDLQQLDREALVAKYGLIRAEAHSDDQALQCQFFAEDWMIVASDDEILALADEEWGQCEEADRVAHHFDRQPGLAALFDYLHIRNPIDDLGFECTINRADALRWLHRHRHGLWARIVCQDHGIRIVEAQEPEIAGRFDWLDDQGNASDTSFDNAEEAAMDAVARLGLDTAEAVSPLFLAYWSTSAFHSPSGMDIRRVVGPALFCEGSGYSPEDIHEIGGLAVGQSWRSRDYDLAHTVTRIR